MNGLIKGSVIVVLSFGFALTESDDSYAQCGACNTPHGAVLTGGPGTEMTRIINRLGLGSDCGYCRALAAEMDRGGPEWVRQNFQHVVSRTIGNAERLGHRMGPVRRLGVRAIVRTSIRRSR